MSRRSEIAISRLRGLQGGELAALLAAEPLLVLVTGGLAGLVLGAAGAAVAAGAWGGRTGGLPGADAVLAGLVIVLAGLVAVLLGMAGALREPLGDQISLAARPRASSVVAVFGDVLVLVGAAVAVYRGSVAGEDPDWVVLAGPALVGLAVGQAVVWLVRLAARLALRPTAPAGWPVSSPYAAWPAPPTPRPRCGCWSPPRSSPRWPSPVPPRSTTGPMTPPASAPVPRSACRWRTAARSAPSR